MSKSAMLKYNPGSGKWEASDPSGKVFASSRDKDYIIRVVTGGFSKKAGALGITGIIEIGQDGLPADPATNGVLLSPEEIAQQQANLPTIEKEFPINERFDIMADFVTMVAQRQLASTVVTGDGGLGKTFTVMRSIKAAGIKDLTGMEVGVRETSARGYIVVKGYSTPKGLFRTLYENRHQLIIFDDCDSVLRDPTAVNLLKAALDSYDVRMVTWNAETSFGGEDDLPKSFEFTGGVIFISNMAKAKIPGPIRSRAMCADVSMSRPEVIERMRLIANSDEFMPEIEIALKLEALEFVAENATNPMITELNLRSLVNVVNTRVAKPSNWKRLGLYSMANA